jgi:hypothetical protein
MAQLSWRWPRPASPSTSAAAYAVVGNCSARACSELDGQEIVEFSDGGGVGPGLEVVAEFADVVNADAVAGLLGDGE